MIKDIFLKIILLFPLLLNSQIQRVDPPNWWIDFKNNSFQLLFKGESISNLSPIIKYQGLKINNITRSNSSDNYLFVDFVMDSTIKPGKFTILFNGNTQIKYKYELKERSFDRLRFNGFDSSDVIYLITPDRFANGDYANDEIHKLRENKINRSDDYARHGGDINGIIDNIDYLSKMGFTALWTNPFLINDMEKHSYHGYAVTDHYKIDPRLGSLNDVINLSKKLNSKGIKLIMDQIVNHCGLEHWWIKDLPFDDWLNFQQEFQSKPISIDKMRISNEYNQDSINKYLIKTNHRRTINQDKYSSQFDEIKMLNGWFVSSMPDLNHNNQFMSRYLIQNSIWWIETLGLGGIRQDTYPYSDKKFMSKWASEIMYEYPNITIVGEEWSYNPLSINYWHKDSNNSDGYVSNINSVMDFPLQKSIIEGINEKESWNTGFIKIYESLSNDFYYSNPFELMIFIDNHDINRAYTQFNKNIENFKMAFGYILSIPRIPQILYGSEILMHNSDRPGSHGKIRSDFPGGWKDDQKNGFNDIGITNNQKDAKLFFKKILNFRKSSRAIQKGETIHFAPFENVYVLFRIFQEELLMIVLNKNLESYKLNLNRFREIDILDKTYFDIIGNDSIKVKNSIIIPEKGFYIFSIM
ncbi:MAG: glycoside hydrolase family 13 protein [Flavobacteriaceae bacterium]|nr:glycoside hydrolase family 13 protein [Flavobacteriaceae bacterium]